MRKTIVAKKMFFIMTIVLFVLLSLSYISSASMLEMTYASVYDGEISVEPTDTFYFKFNCRIDPCDNFFSISGGDACVSDWSVEGKNVTVYLTKSLSYATTYTLKLEGLGDLYGNVYDKPIITFSTKGLEVQEAYFTDKNGIVSNEIDTESTIYYATIVNKGSVPESICFVMRLTEENSGEIKDLIFKSFTLQAGETLYIDEGFKNFGKDNEVYKIKVFYLKNVETLCPYTAKKMSMQIASDK